MRNLAIPVIVTLWLLTGATTTAIAQPDPQPCERGSPT